MELRPADLGDAYQTALVLRRARAKEGGAQKSTVWSRRWLSKLRLSAEVERDTTPAIVRYARPIQLPMGLFGPLIMAVGWASPETLVAHLATTLLGAGLLYVGLDTLPSFQVRKLYTKAITEAEILRLQSATQSKTAKAPTSVGELLGSRGANASPFSNLFDLSSVMPLPPIFAQLFGGRSAPRAESAASLESDYFALILAALQTPTPTLESGLAEELRTTLRQIGAAVAIVRRSEIIEDTVEAADLVGDAEMLAARARTEDDHYVAASLLRQAQAKIAQAKIVERNVFMRRRTRALGAELRAQIAAAQSSLRNVSSQGVMNAASGGAFRVISDSVRTLATEAESVAMAHDELAVALGEAAPRPTATATTATAQTAESSAPVSASVETGRYNGPSNEKTIINGRRGR